MEIDFLEGLNSEQYEAVTTTEGPLLVLSGAGTGKTKVLTTRQAHILYSGLARPWECLLLTFTNKAAHEMRERLQRMIGGLSESVWLGTFHSIGLRILRSHTDRLPLESNFTILNDDDQKHLVKAIMKEMRIDVKMWPPAQVVEIISLFKDKMLYPKTEELYATDNDFAGGKIYDIYAKYQERLFELNAVDFGDLILHPLTLMRDHDDIREKYQKKFKYIMVDEYQDTNTCQYQFLKVLSAQHHNLCCVGDDDQSIYSWRGADVENILRFPKEFENAKIIRLEMNYRSTKHILSAASGLIKHNRYRHDKTLKPCDVIDHSEAQRVQVHSFMDAEQEAYFIAQEIENLQRSGESLSEMAVLIRAGFLSRIFEERFMKSGINYKIVGGTKFYDRQEIKDAIAYLRLIAHPQDDLAFERIINLPKRGIGAATIQSFHTMSKDLRMPLSEAVTEMVRVGAVKGKMLDTLKTFTDLLFKWREDLQAMTPAELLDIVLLESGYLKMWQDSNKPDAPSRVENLKELISVLKYKFETVDLFLEHISLVMDMDNADDDEKVSVMTLHAAKGLEFNTVFLPAWEEGVFPSDKSMEDETLTQSSGLEEERRLAYVGITRARANSYISYASSRFVFGNWAHNFPSLFVAELPAGDIQLFSHKNVMHSQPSFKKNWGVKKKESQSKPKFDFEFAQDLSSILAGKKVSHAEFGEGQIIEASETQLTVFFSDGGKIKNVPAKSVKFL